MDQLMCKQICLMRNICCDCSPMQQHTVGPPQSSGFTMTSSMQPNMLDRPWMAVSAPFQQSHYL